MSNLHETLHALSNSADSLWREYLATGPGSLKTDALDHFKELLHQSRAELSISTVTLRDEWLRDFDATMSELEPLLTRCVERTEGLSFVTGEAGLIPRRDLHERVEALLAATRRLHEEVE